MDGRLITILSDVTKTILQSETENRNNSVNNFIGVLKSFNIMNTNHSIVDQSTIISSNNIAN
ncbi:MAG: hypothetical protein ACE5SW_06540 [Nitrososphaeraceae archaeon]